MKTRDMTLREFTIACERAGFKREGFMGYYQVGGGLCVSILNAGPRRRDQLAYLHAAADRQEVEQRNRERRAQV